MQNGNIAGAIVERNGYKYMIVRSRRNTRLGQPAFGFVDLETGDYNELDIGLSTLYDILVKTQVKFVAKGLDHYITQQTSKDKYLGRFY